MLVLPNNNGIGLTYINKFKTGQEVYDGTKSVSAVKNSVLLHYLSYNCKRDPTPHS